MKSGFRREGKREDSAFVFAAGNADFYVMTAGDFPDDGKAEACAFAGGVARVMEPVKNELQIGLRNAASFVRDDDDRSILSQGQAYAATGRRIFDRVVDDGKQHLTQAGVVPANAL